MLLLVSLLLDIFSQSTGTLDLDLSVGTQGVLMEASSWMNCWWRIRPQTKDLRFVMARHCRLGCGVECAELDGRARPRHTFFEVLIGKSLVHVIGSKAREEVRMLIRRRQYAN
jgi:hypothetical protein